MDCRLAEKLIQQNIDHCLSAAEQQTLLQHLAECPHCAAFDRKMRALDALLREEMADCPVPQDLTARVMSALPAPARPRHRRVYYAVGLSVAAAALLLVAGVAGLFSDSDPSEQISNPTPIAEAEPPQFDFKLPPLLPDTEEEPLTEVVPDETIIANVEPQVKPAEPEPPQDENFSDSIELPPVAVNSESHGAYSQTALVGYSDYDVYLTGVNGDTVDYFIHKDGKYLQLQISTAGGEPVLLAESGFMSTVSNNGVSNSDEQGLYYSATSPDGAYSVISSTNHTSLIVGENETLLVELGGGNVLSWCADSNKVLFTDNNGNLYLYYVQEQLLFGLAGGVKNAYWHGNGNVIFSAYDSALAHTSIYRVTTP